jgi:hypothetical protein
LSFDSAQTVHALEAMIDGRSPVETSEGTISGLPASPYKNPDFSGFKGLSPVQAAARKIAFVLAEQKDVAALGIEHAELIATADPSEIPGKILGFLEGGRDTGGWGRLIPAYRPDVPMSERKAKELIVELQDGGVLGGHIDPDGLARQWKDLFSGGSGSREAALSRVRIRLNDPTYKHLYPDGEPVEWHTHEFSSEPPPAATVNPRANLLNRGEYY